MEYLIYLFLDSYLSMCLVIAAADEARKNYNTVDAKFRNIENEIR